MTQGTTKRMIIMLLLAGLLFGGIFGFQAFKAKMIKKYIGMGANPPQAVATATAVESSWQPTVEAIGTVRASQGADLAAEVGGLVTAIHFESGQNVRAGDVLVDLNAAPLRAQLDQLKAAAALAEQNYQRDLAQYKVQAISKAVVDTDEATLKAAKAQVSAQQATIDQRTVRAPFSGRLGIRQIDLGQYLAPGAAIVSLQKLDPVYIDFTVPQPQIGIVHVGMKVDVSTSGASSKHFEGKVSAVEPEVDTATRNLKVRATIPNPRAELLPGMFATVHVDEGQPEQLVTLPNTAITYNPYGATVFVVHEDGKQPDGKPKLSVEQRFVSTSLTRGDQVAVTSGVKAGETVVTAGQIKLRNGSPVFVNNSVQPSADAHPQLPSDQ